MSPHGDVKLQVDFEVSDTADRHDGINAVHERRVWNVMLAATRQAPDDLGLPGIQLEAVSPHPQSDFTDTQRNANLQPGGATRPAETIYLRVVSLKMWTQIMALNQLQ